MKSAWVHPEGGVWFMPVIVARPNDASRRQCADVDSNDPLRTPELDAGHDDPPSLVRVGRRDGPRSAVVAIVVVTLGLATAVWKPWDHGVTQPIPPIRVANSSASVVPASEAVAPAATAPQPDSAWPGPRLFRGLDLGSMAIVDGHTDWGVAVAYVSGRQFDIAVARRTPTITPVVSWRSIEPSQAGPGPFAGHPGATSLAIAATWPESIRPLAIQLLSIGPRVRVIALGQDLAALIGVTTGPNPGPIVSAASGAFFLATDKPLTEPLAWTGNGWPAGDYAFQVALGGGVVVTLPFRIGSPTGP
ncbi:MAG: hypothetical protein QOI37_539 [Chloroflexota bacterium]|nr:hypothetical protein [Chloroflexota bacterium]